MDTASATGNTEAVLAMPRTKASNYAYPRVLLLLIAFRFVNALSIATFFQPDEYFQALEPAWEIAFGGQSGAWITWVCFLQSVWCWKALT